MRIRFPRLFETGPVPNYKGTEYRVKSWGPGVPIGSGRRVAVGFKVGLQPQNTTLSGPPCPPRPSVSPSLPPSLPPFWPLMFDASGIPEIRL